MVLEYFRKIKESFLEQKQQHDDSEQAVADTKGSTSPSRKPAHASSSTEPLEPGIMMNAGSQLSEAAVEELWKQGNATPLKHQYSLTYATALRPSTAIKRPKDWPLWRVVDSDVKLNPTLDTGKGGGKNKKKRRAKTKTQDS